MTTTKKDRCVNCGKKLKRKYERTYSNNEAKMAHTSRHRGYDVDSWDIWDGETYWAYEGLFDTLRCAAEFAAGAYKAGYRRRKRTK